MQQGEAAAPAAVLAGEHDGAGHLLHRQVPTNNSGYSLQCDIDVASASNNLAPDVAPELAAARGAAGQLGPAVGADEVAGVALQDRGQHIVETDRALNMVRLLLILSKLQCVSSTLQ